MPYDYVKRLDEILAAHRTIEGQKLRQELATRAVEGLLFEVDSFLAELERRIDDAEFDVDNQLTSLKDEVDQESEIATEFRDKNDQLQNIVERTWNRLDTLASQEHTQDFAKDGEQDDLEKPGSEAPDGG